MARPSKFTVDQALDAALEIVEKDGMGALSVSSVCREIGAPSGSLYHRFDSRAALLVALWLRCAARFQQGYSEILESEREPRAAVRAAVAWFIDHTRRHRGEAMVLNLYRRRDLIDGPWPQDVQRRAQDLERDQREALRRIAKRLWPHGGADLPRMAFALIRIPLAAVLAELHDGPPHPETVAWVQVAVDAVLNAAHPPPQAMPDNRHLKASRPGRR